MQYICHGQIIKNHILFTLKQTECLWFNHLLPYRATWKLSRHNLLRLQQQSPNITCNTTSSSPLRRTNQPQSSLTNNKINEAHVQLNNKEHYKPFKEHFSDISVYSPQRSPFLHLFSTLFPGHIVLCYMIFCHWFDTLGVNNNKENDDPRPDNNVATTFWGLIETYYKSCDTAGHIEGFVFPLYYVIAPQPLHKCHNYSKLEYCQYKNHPVTGLEISACPLTQASLKTVGRVQITDHSANLARMTIISRMTRIYYSK